MAEFLENSAPASKPLNKLDLRFALDEDAEELSVYVNRQYAIEEEGSSNSVQSRVFRKVGGRVSVDEVSFEINNPCSI